MNRWTDGRTHTYIQIDRHMHVHAQTARHTCTGIDGQTSRMHKQITETYIIRYRDIDRNIHARACRGIHAPVQIGLIL